MTLKEVGIQATCADFLILDGWRRVRMDLQHLRGLGVQEPGMADDLFIRYGQRRNRDYPQGEEDQVMWIEWKRPKKQGGKMARHQHEWHMQERARGALTLKAGEDFEASVDGFIAWYGASGLQRKRIAA